jgi:hypothetical protein
MPKRRAVAPGGGRLHGLAVLPGSGGQGLADADLGWRGAGGQARPARREAGPGLGLAVAVPVPVDLDAAPGQASQDGVPVGRGEGGGQAGGRGAGPGGGDDGPAGSGERDLTGVHWLAGAASPAGRDGDRRSGAGGSAGQFDGSYPGGVLLRGQSRGRRA